MSWLMMSAVAVGCAGVLVPAVRRHLLRRRAVARARTELAWFHQQERRRTPRHAYGRHALRAPGDGQLST